MNKHRQSVKLPLPVSFSTPVARPSFVLATAVLVGVGVVISLASSKAAAQVNSTARTPSTSQATSVPADTQSGDMANQAYSKQAMWTGATHGQPAAVPQLDITRYAGTWYEIGRLPIFFQRRCASDVTARYAKRSANTINVTNRCRNAQGEIEEATGVAHINTKQNSKLKVTFLPSWLRWLPVGRANYWVLALDKNYRYALVGTPNRRYLWLLSRTPTMSKAAYQQFLQVARVQGYDLKAFKRTPQSLANAHRTD